MKQISLFVFFTFLCFSTNAQNYYRDYGYSQVSNGFTEIASTINDGLLLAGADQSQKRLILVKTNCNGEGEWAKEFVDTSAFNLVDIAYTTDDEIAICCQLNGKMGIIRTDLLGNIIWSNYYDYSSSNAAEGLMAVENGSTLLVGGGCIGNNFAIKIDNQGNIIWSYQYYNVYGGFILAEKLAANGDYLIANKFSFEQGVGIARIDPNGNLKWFKRIDAPNDEWAWDIEEDADGNIVMVGQTRGFNPTNKDQAFIIKADSAGNFLWSKSLELGTADYSVAVQSIKGGYMLGSWVNYTGLINNQWVFSKFSTNGDWVWSTEFGSAYSPSFGGDEIREILVRNENEVYAVGRIVDGYTLLKSDTLPNMFCYNIVDTPIINTISFNYTDITNSINKIPITFNIIPLTINTQPINFIDTIICGSSPNLTCSSVGINKNYKTDKLTIYPNPSSNLFNIKLNNAKNSANVTVLTMSGKIIYKNTLIGNKQLVINATNWAKGVYVLRTLINNNVKFNKLVVH